MNIRPEAEADLPAIDQIHLEAFADRPNSQQTEHLIVRALRASGALTLSLVAEVNGRVVGHIAFSPALVDDRDLGWYTLGPVAVLPAFQRRGIGSSLILRGLQAMRALQAQGCLLVGAPSYYRRFGFQDGPSPGNDGAPPECLMCLPLHGALPPGVAAHHPAFSTTA